jgi:cyanophycinase-like exopeptidase
MTPTMRIPARALRALSVFAVLASCARSGAVGGSSTPKVGPPKGSAIVVGGGNIGHDIFGKFIELAGGPDALIIDIPTAGGAATYPTPTSVTQSIRANGARNVVQIHTIDRKVADSDSFVAVLKQAKGIWFEGGRQNLLMDAYAGTKAEVEFHNILARGGVEAGSSAGASIQGSFLIRGASNGNTTMDAPGRNVGFGFLRDRGVPLDVIFGAFAGVALLSVILVMLIRLDSPRTTP